jgi:glucose/arabinose dehydrogenase
MPQPFLTGFIGNEAAGEVYGRPMGLAIGADGSLLVMDDAAGRIWKVTYMGQ